MMKIKSLSAKQIQINERFYKKVWSMYLRGIKQVKIASEVGVTKQRICQIISRMKEGEGDYYYKHRQRNAAG
jgi:DNA-binding transcriptional regulator LsrR (DeoR family)